MISHKSQWRTSSCEGSPASFLIINPLETIMRKIIALAIAGFVWKKLQSRFRSRSRSGY
jgi:hypothetical protein